MINLNVWAQRKAVLITGTVRQRCAVAIYCFVSLSYFLGCRHEALSILLNCLIPRHLTCQRVTEDKLRSLTPTLPPHPVLVAGAQAAQCQPLFASHAQQHHPQSGPSRSPTIGRSVEHGADGGLSDGRWRLHGCGSGGGTEPLCSHWRGDGGNRTLPATGAAGGGGGGQGEVNVELDYVKLHPQCLIFDLWCA